MKPRATLFIAVAAFAATLLAGCGRPNSSASTGTSPDEAAPASAAIAAVDRPTTGRAVAITGNDTMKFSTTEIDATPGEALAVTLTNIGMTPKFSMGHDWVLLQPDTDLNAFTAEAVTAAATDYIPASFKDKVIARTKLLGPKESDTALFYAPRAPGKYPFICSFPGHMQVGMKGYLIVK